MSIKSGGVRGEKYGRRIISPAEEYLYQSRGGGRLLIQTEKLMRSNFSFPNRNKKVDQIGVGGKKEHERSKLTLISAPYLTRIFFMWEKHSQSTILQNGESFTLYSAYVHLFTAPPMKHEEAP
ncbi:unnamed protein product [Allacma fusca]|uniref:Uncharacterized protein n=1 Tax=Allacma fusca TaxID=39272 RepID=A0A8J2PDH1_9HEXA|nr:unnamed protein product [Allacma fusca]